MAPVKNLGPKSRAWLAEIGIHGPADLAGRDPVEIYLTLKARRPKEVTLNFLWGLVAGLLGCHWSDLPPDLKEELKARVADAASR